MTSAADIKTHLEDLYAERRLAEPAGLTRCESYMHDLHDEIAEFRSLFVVAAVTEIAIFRGELSGPLLG